ncbi:MAG: ligase-associated DNA damage response endonuclease PdeM [Leeuwenhoekiella sp.]
MQKTLSIHDNTFVLDPCGAIFWQEKDMLLIADVHLGKVGHFRKYGAAVPNVAASDNFKKLNKVADRYEAASICFLGDLFHSALNIEWKLFEKWVGGRTEKILLIAGNHDIISPLRFEALNISIYSEAVVGPFLLTHHPEERAGLFNFCGHIHPGIKLGGAGRQLLKLSCFFKTENQLILPAFGIFTGNYYLKAETGDEVFAITQEEVIQVC